MTGAAAFAALGTTFNDAFVAAGMLGSFYVLLRERHSSNPSTSDRPVLDGFGAWCMAGALAGATTGLTLTAVVYCLGLAGAAIALP